MAKRFVRSAAALTRRDPPSGYDNAAALSPSGGRNADCAPNILPGGAPEPAISERAFDAIYLSISPKFDSFRAEKLGQRL